MTINQSQLTISKLKLTLAYPNCLPYIIENLHKAIINCSNDNNLLYYDIINFIFNHKPDFNFQLSYDDNKINIHSNDYSVDALEYKLIHLYNNYIEDKNIIGARKAILLPNDNYIKLLQIKPLSKNQSTHLSTSNNTIDDNSHNIDNKSYEFVNHPSHYNEWSYEVIDMMEKIYGTEQTALWCEMTAYKYAMRMGFKPTDSIQQDIDKRNWYLKKAKQLKNK